MDDEKNRIQIEEDEPEVIFDDMYDDDIFIEGEKLSPLQKIIKVFTNPNKAFRNLAVHTDLIVPMLIVLIGLPILSFLLQNKEQFIQMMIDEYQANNIVPPTVDALKTQYYTTKLMVGLGPILIWVVKGFIVSGFGPMLGGKERKFKDTIAVLAYSYLPVFAGQIIVSLILFTSNVSLNFSLGALLPSAYDGSFLEEFLSQLNLFTIWYQALAIVGFSYLYDLKKRIAAIPVLATWGVWILIYAGANNLVKTAM
ncbi:Yip1 family protein [Clostridiaceae bacterium M8S5]|nr:Yip1 family protein [Clostridiaceae bacterium M8S5]